MLILPTGNLKYSYNWNHCRILATSLSPRSATNSVGQHFLPGKTLSGENWRDEMGSRRTLARKTFGFFSHQWLPSKEKFWLLSRQQLLILARNNNDFFLAIEGNKFILAKICTFWQYKRGAMEIKMWVSPRGGTPQQGTLLLFSCHLLLREDLLHIFLTRVSPRPKPIAGADC